MLSNSQYNINNNKSYYLFSTNYEPGAVQSILYTFAHLILIPVEVSTLTNEVAEAIFSPDLSSGLNISCPFHIFSQMPQRPLRLYGFKIYLMILLQYRDTSSGSGRNEWLRCAVI